MFIKHIDLNMGFNIIANQYIVTFLFLNYT